MLLSRVICVLRPSTVCRSLSRRGLPGGASGPFPGSHLVLFAARVAIPRYIPSHHPVLSPGLPLRFRRGGDPLAYASSFIVRYNPSPYALRIWAGVCFVPPTVPVGPSAVYAVFGRVHAVFRVRLRPRRLQKAFPSSVGPGEALPCFLPAASPAVVHGSVPYKGAAVVPAGSACRRSAVFAFAFCGFIISLFAQ